MASTRSQNMFHFQYTWIKALSVILLEILNGKQQKPPMIYKTEKEFMKTVLGISQNPWENGDHIQVMLQEQRSKPCSRAGLRSWKPWLLPPINATHRTEFPACHRGHSKSWRSCCHHSGHMALPSRFWLPSWGLIFDMSDWQNLCHTVD